MLWDLHQDMEIRALQSQVRGAQDARVAAQEHTSAAVGPIEERLDRLTLICHAMWSFLQERTNLTDQDLQQRVTELDLKDGKLDGKYTRPPTECPECGAMISPKFGRCLFCGHENCQAEAFDRV